MTEDAGARAPRSVLTIIGPTAVGKTAVAVALARELGGEIVSADSRQVYRGMDVGTAKPTAEERAAARHHLIDIVEPSEIYDAARFASDAERVLSELTGAGVEPVIAGGTGFYLASLFEGLFEGPGRDDDLRRELRTKLQAEGAAKLHEELAGVDPESAQRLHVNDTARVIRALEVYLATGRPLSNWHGEPRRTPAFRPGYVGLSMPRDLIYERINRRVDAMMAAGLLEEVRELVSSGRLSSSMPAANAVGYRELLPVVEEGADADKAVALIKRSTRRYAKRQVAWFSRLSGVKWIDPGRTSIEDTVSDIVSRWSRR